MVFYLGNIIRGAMAMLNQDYDTLSAFGLTPRQTCLMFSLEKLLARNDANQEKKVELRLSKATNCSISGKTNYWYSYYQLNTIEGKMLAIFIHGSMDISSRE
ncbi:MAG TPA: hypothetical protein VFC96_02430, partial [Anaerovoracaceae bacterium]|nr:hypothetical protein [Anaerovoracaceae bacterium]